MFIVSCSADLDIQFILANNTLGALRSVERGDADYALLADLPALQLIKFHQMKVLRAGPPVWPQSYVFAVVKSTIAKSQLAVA